MGATGHLGSIGKSQRRVAALLLALFAGAGWAHAAVTPSGANAAADAFYVDLLRTGAEAYERKDFAAAVTDLRLASFGFLDQPGLLAEGLARLGMAQAAGGDREGFMTTFGRLAEVERRFSSYSQGLAEGLRRSFETVALGLVPSTQQGVLPGLQERGQQQAIAELGRLAPSKRRAELEKRLAREPGDPRWPMLLAQLDLEQKKPAAAVKRLDALLALTPGDDEARCLRARAGAEAGRCAAAVEDFRLCSRSGGDPVLVTRRLECLVETKSWAEANTVLAGLSEARRQDGAIAKLASKVAAGLAADAPRRAPAATDAPVTPRAAASAPPATARKPAVPSKPAPAKRPERSPTASAGTPSQPKPAPPQPAAAVPAAPAAAPAVAPAPPAPVVPQITGAELAELERARQMLRAARVASDVGEALRVARVVADAHPDYREAQLLTAEIAYRGSSWSEAVAYFERADPGDKQPALLFYYAVALYESGNRPRAAAVLQRCLAKLQLTPVVQSYVERILGPGSNAVGGAGR